MVCHENRILHFEFCTSRDGILQTSFWLSAFQPLFFLHHLQISEARCYGTCSSLVQPEALFLEAGSAPGGPAVTCPCIEVTRASWVYPTKGKLNVFPILFPLSRVPHLPIVTPGPYDQGRSLLEGKL